MAQKKFYAIAVGRKPGIYENWPQAQAQVLGFPGAVYKGFASRKEAKVWLENPSTNKTRRKRPPPESGRVKTEHPVRSDAILVYSDGGARNNPGPGGYGIVIVDGEQRREISGGFNHTTNNRMELTGCIVALRTLSDCNRPILIYTDSRYVVNGINKGWANNWRRRGWIKPDGKPALNPDLWGELLNLVQDCDITFHWVKGHAGHPENERCDQLAVAASNRQNLPEDKEYMG